MSGEGWGTQDETRAVHGGERRPGPDGSLVFPIFQSTVFETRPNTSHDDIDYIRSSNTPSQVYLQERLAALEGAEAAIATASGTAAMSTILATLLRAGDHLIATRELYGGTFQYITGHIERLGLRHTLVDPRSPDSWRGALTPETKVFLVESIGNPLMRIPCLEDIVGFSREHELISVIDNTFASPVNFKPLTIGFDLSFHSATKYLNGHSDLVAGCVMGGRTMIERIRKTLNQLGGSLDPHAGFLLERGLKTVAVRMRSHNENATKLAGFLDGHPRVRAVNYPGLSAHPDHREAVKLMSGFSGMLSFELDGGSADQADALLAALRIAYVATSLGGVETLVTRPAVTSHAGMTPEQRASVGIADDLIRVSCGIEGTDDLLADFDQALVSL